MPGGAPRPLLVALGLGLVQLTMLLDFMLLPPLGPRLMPALGLSPAAFGMAVSVYAAAGAVAGLAAAGVADRFDRKPMLLLCLGALCVGMLLTAMARSEAALLLARALCGAAGGILGATVLATAADVFPEHLRGRAMSIAPTAFAVAQIAGLPLGLALAARGDWHTPWYALLLLGLLTLLVLQHGLPPVRAHLDEGPGVHRPLPALRAVALAPQPAVALAATIVLTAGSYMLMTFSSTYAVSNLGVAFDALPVLYVAAGAASLLGSPLAGRWTDRAGAFPVFVVASALSAVSVITYTHLGPSTLPVVATVNGLLFLGVTARMVAANTLLTSAPDAASRGAFMNLNAAVSLLAGGVGASVGGALVHQEPGALLQGYDTVGVWVVASMAVGTGLMYRLARLTQRR